MTAGDSPAPQQVEVQLGPLPGSSALIWAETALANLATIRANPHAEIPSEVLDGFERFVTEWHAAARADSTFHWVGEVDVAEVRHLATFWALLANSVRSEENPSGLDAPPSEAQAFYDALVAAMAEVLAVGDEIHFAEKFDEVAPAFDAAIPTSTTIDPSNQPTRVLLVDDTEDIRLLYKIALQSQLEFEVYGEAANGQEALDLVSAGCPDAILLDVMMPVMDGMTALPLLRERCPGSRITVITAGLTAELREEAMAKGAHSVVDKQASILELKKLLSKR